MKVDYGTRKVTSRGGSLQITLPAVCVKTLKIKKGTLIHITSNEKKLILEVEEQ